MFFTLLSMTIKVIPIIESHFFMINGVLTIIECVTFYDDYDYTRHRK